MKTLLITLYTVLGAVFGLLVFAPMFASDTCFSLAGPDAWAILCTINLIMCCVFLGAAGQTAESKTNQV